MITQIHHDRHNKSIVKKVEHVLEVWIERNVYQIDFVEDLLNALEGSLED